MSKTLLGKHACPGFGNSPAHVYGMANFIEKYSLSFVNRDFLALVGHETVLIRRSESREIAYANQLFRLQGDQCCGDSA